MSWLEVVLGGLGLTALASLTPAGMAPWLRAAGCLAGLVGAAAALVSGQTFQKTLAWSLPLGDPWLRLDPLSAFFLVPALAIAGLVSVYGHGYLGPRARGHWFFFDLTTIAMGFVLLAGDWVLFLIAWEVMSVASFLLVVWEDERAAVRRAGLTYLAATHLGTLALLAMVAQTGQPAGTLLPLALIGFGVKAGFVPLHTWLPWAHPAAPSHVSALLSGVILKTGVYGLLRVQSQFGTPPLWWGETLLAIGLLSGVFGVVAALAQPHLKRLLAYSSVENMGLVALGLGLGTMGCAAGEPGLAALGLAGGLLHVWNHATFKSLLFLGAGAVGRATGSLELDRLGGLAHSMPRTARTFLTGAAAISGVPPLNGFLSEFLILLAALTALQSNTGALVIAGGVALGGLALVSGLAVACFARAYGVTFLGQARTGLTGQDPPPAMAAPMGALAALCVAGGLAGPWAPAVLKGPVALAGSLPGDLTVDLLGGAGLGQVSLLSLAVLVVGALFRLSRRTAAAEPTWGCGYGEPTPRMQYTGASLAAPLLALFGPVPSRRRLEGLFPERGALTQSAVDPVEHWLVRPPLVGLGRLAQAARRLQHGRIQLYLLYIILTLVALIAVEVL